MSLGIILTKRAQPPRTRGGCHYVKAVVTQRQLDFNVLLALSHQANSASHLKIIFYKRVIPKTFVSKYTQEVRVSRVKLYFGAKKI